MPTIPCNPGPFYWTNPVNIKPRGGSFRPAGPVLYFAPQHAGPLPNPAEFRQVGSRSLSARIFVGFNVGKKQRWDMSDLVPIVAKVRTSQGQPPDASFIAQQGIYTSFHTQKTVVEQGAQVIIISLTKQAPKAFEADMVELAEEVARQLKQELVILELQRAGVTQQTIGVRP